MQARADRSSKLMEWAFDIFKNVNLLFEKGTVMAQVPVFSPTRQDQFDC